MTHSIELSDAKLLLPDLVREAGSGTEVIITQCGNPVARIISVETALLNREPGSAKGLFVVPDDFDAPLEELSEYQ